MSKKARKMIVMVLTVVLVVMCAGRSSIEAATKAAKAKKAYQKFLENIWDKKDFQKYKEFRESGEIEFTVADISGDKIPELIVVATHSWLEIHYIYTYQNGKMKKIMECSYFDKGEPVCFYPSKHILVTSEGDSWTAGSQYYKITGSKAKLVASELDGDYYLDGKKTAKSKFNTYVKKIKKAKSYKLGSGKYTYKKNTKKNRKKYLK